MRKTLGICLLVLLLTGSAAAGEMPNPAPAAPSQPTNAVQEPTADGEIPNNADGESPNNAADTFTGAALNLLAGVLALI